jgi:hypothetical protein
MSAPPGGVLSLVAKCITALKVCMLPHSVQEWWKEKEQMKSSRKIKE